MHKKPHVLVINDDGIHAPGLQYLWEAVADGAEVSIVAPAQEKSGVGMCLTLHEPLRIESVPWKKETPAWKITGTPADCVRLALSVVLDKKPDIIISGINRGLNSGRSILHSGTVGGIIEGTLRNVPGIAFSCEDSGQGTNYTFALKYILPIIHYVLQNPLGKGTFFNVNFPYFFKDTELKGVKLARQGRGYWVESPAQRIHPEGRPYYWLGGKWCHEEEHEESDVALLQKGFMTAVPIHVHELTDYTSLEKHKTGFEEFFHSFTEELNEKRK